MSTRNTYHQFLNARQILALLLYACVIFIFSLLPTITNWWFSNCYYFTLGSFKATKPIPPKYKELIYGSLHSLETLAKGKLCSTDQQDMRQKTFLFCQPQRMFKRFAVFATTLKSTNGHYVFYPPLTVRAWTRLEYGSLVILVGSYSLWTSSSMTLLVLSALVSEGAGIVFVQTSHPDNDVLISQTSRLFAAYIFRSCLSDSDIIFTSDVDLWPLDPQYYINITEQTIASLNAFCCGHFSYKNNSIRMLPMANIGMSALTWRKVLPLSVSYKRSKRYLFGADDILLYLAQYFGNMVNRHIIKGSKGWYYDQKMISIKVDEWVRVHGEGSVQLRHRTKGDRIDRASFHIPPSLKGKSDAHLPLKPSAEWGRLKALLSLMYGKDGLTHADWYYRAFRAATVSESWSKRQHVN